MCMGFGSILMPLTGLNSFGVHLYGGTGVGKTTAMYGNTGIWGDPHALTLGQRDTPNSRMNRGEVMCNLPLNSDEMTNMTGKDISDYSYQLSDGKQKNRMAGGGNIERVRGKPWQLMALSTGNMSFYEEMQRLKDNPKAEMQRMLEIRVGKNIKAILDKTDQLFQDSKENYGHFSVEFVQYVINNRDSLRDLYAKIKGRIDTAAGLEAENRFWSGGCAATVVGALAAKQMGLINYDTNKLYAWIVSELKKIKAHVDDSGASVQQLVTEFATENWTNILKIKSTKTMHNGGQPLDGVVPLIIPEQNPRNMFVARFETDTNMFYMVPKAFKKHLNDRHINYNSTVEEMEKQMGAKKVQVRLTKGTNFNLPPIRVIAVKLDGLGGVPENTEV